MEHAEIQILLLLLVGSLVGLVALRMKVPYTLALVVAGVALGAVHLEALAGLHLSAELLFLVLLPALLFEAAWHLDFSDFRRNAGPILLLAVPGVLLAVGVTAGLTYALLQGTGLAPRFGWMHALLLAAVVAATDPISVLAIFKKLGVPRRLYLLVEGESLVNDGVAVVVFVIVAAVFGIRTVHGDAPPLEGAAEIAAHATRTFVWMAGGGVLVGALVGAVGTAASRQVDDHLIETTITTLVAYGSFLLAEQIHVSGVLATVTAGILTGSFGARVGMSTRTRLAVDDFWEYAAFLANTFVFLLVGLELELGRLASVLHLVVLAFVATTIGRAVAVYGLVPLARPADVPWAWRHVMWWGGLKGSLSMVLVLGLPLTFPGRTLLIDLVFGVVAISLFLQGLTIAPLLRAVGLREPEDPRRIALDAERARSIGAARALRALTEMERENLVDPSTAEALASWYRERREQAAAAAAALSDGPDEHAVRRLVDTALLLADAEREGIRHAVRTGAVGDAAAGRAIDDLDARVVALQGAGRERPAFLDTAPGS